MRSLSDSYRNCSFASVDLPIFKVERTHRIFFSFFFALPLHVLLDSRKLTFQFNELITRRIVCDEFRKNL